MILLLFSLLFFLFESLITHLCPSLSFCLSLSLSGGLTQRADVGAEASHSAASVSQHSGGLREQLAGRRYHYNILALYSHTEEYKCHETSTELFLPFLAVKPLVSLSVLEHSGSVHIAVCVLFSVLITECYCVVSCSYTNNMIYIR